MELKTITSRDNPFVKRLRALAHSARDRRQEGQTVLDGAHLVESALDARWPLREMIVSESGVARPEVQGLLGRCPDVSVTCLNDRLFAQISPVDTPSGVLALMDMPATPELPAAFSGSVLLLDGVQDPGNLGTILRTAAAAGLRDILLTPGCAQAWSPRVLRAGMGGHFRLCIHEQVDSGQVLAGFSGPILATGVGAAARSLYECDLDRPVAWLFGAEGAGLSPAVAALATETVTIPMSAAVESLNVGAAVAICLFEQVRQRAF